MSDKDKVQDIITQLQRLSIRQSALLERLEQLSESSTRAFRVGDQVDITNPGLTQPDWGTIVRIGETSDRITVLAKKGNKQVKIVRASRNLTLRELQNHE